MKKICFSLLLMLSVSNIMAQDPRPWTFIVLKPIQNLIISDPTIRPRSVDETAAVSAMLVEGDLLIASESITADVSISVVNNFGSVVYSTTANMAPGSEVSISTENWEAGAYTLYINYNTTSLVGDFELE